MAWILRLRKVVTESHKINSDSSNRGRFTTRIKYQFAIRQGREYKARRKRRWRRRQLIPCFVRASDIINCRCEKHDTLYLVFAKQVHGIGSCTCVTVRARDMKGWQVGKYMLPGDYIIVYAQSKHARHHAERFFSRTQATDNVVKSNGHSNVNVHASCNVF